jgi:hypothetical protein
MLSGTQLVLLAMYSTVNVVGPAGANLDFRLLPMLACLLVAAAVMTCLQMHIATSLPQRRVSPGPKLARLRRRHAGPAARRA